jgi:hypothetical protein
MPVATCGFRRRAMLALLLAPCAAACRTASRGGEASEPGPAPEPLPVKKVDEEVVVAAWAEPKTLPVGGGQAQILVRLQKRGGTPFTGVEVRLAASSGTLYSSGRILVTDNRGMTRDRLTTRHSARVTLNAGGTRYSFNIRVGDAVDAT